MSQDVPAAASAWQQAIIARVVPQTSRISSFFLRSTLPVHVAGQHVDVRLTADDGYSAQRSYSIASAPGTELIEVAIERLEDGEVSPFFHDIARAGDTIEVRGPIGGHFVWSERDGGPLLLIGGGSGIVPLVAMLRHRHRAAPDTQALLVVSARNWDDIAYRDELLEADTGDERFAFVATTTRAGARRSQDHARRVDATLLREILARWGSAPRHAYVCGSTGFVEVVTRALVHEGVPASTVRAERFGG